MDTQLNNIQVAETYTLLSFQITNIELKLNQDCFVNVQIQTKDRGVLFRRVYICHQYYIQWITDDWIYSFITRHILDIFANNTILYVDDPAPIPIPAPVIDPATTPVVDSAPVA